MSPEAHGLSGGNQFRQFNMVQMERKKAEEEGQRRAEDLRRDAEREEARRRAEADAELKVRYYEVSWVHVFP